MAKKKKRQDLAWKIFVGVMLLSLLVTPLLILISLFIGGGNPYYASPF